MRERSFTYTPDSVLFWQEAGATLKSAGNFNGGTDTSHVIIAFRRMLWLGTPTVQGPSGNFRSSANFGNYGNGTGGCSLEGCRGFMVNADNASWSVDGTGFTLRNTYASTTAVESTGSTPANPSSVAQGLGYAFDFKWQSVVLFADMNAAAGSRIVATFVDGNALSSPTSDTGIAFLTGFNNARGVCISDCNHGSGLATGGALMLSDVIIDTANALPAGCPATPANCLAVVNAYYDKVHNKPVNPGSDAVKCNLFRASYAATVKTDWCLRGPKGSFLANTDGTANAMAVTNDVASTTRTTGNGGSVLYDAPYSQGNEPTDRAFRAWVSPLSTTTVTSSSTTASTSAGATGNVMGNFGGDILTNDRLFIAFLNCPTGATTPSATLPSISAGWTAVASTTSTNPSNDSGTSPRCQWGVWTHVATANYVAPNVPWQTGNPFVDPPTISYGSNGVAPFPVTWIMADYRRKDGAIPAIDASDFTRINQADSGANVSLVIPSITTTSSPDTLVTLCMTRSSARPINPPASTSLSTVQQFSAAASPIITAADEKLSAAGATGTRTYFTTATASANERAGCAAIALH